MMRLNFAKRLEFKIPNHMFSRGVRVNKSNFAVSLDCPWILPCVMISWVSISCGLCTTDDKHNSSEQRKGKKMYPQEYIRHADRNTTTTTPEESSS